MAVVFSLTLFIFCNYCFIQEYIFFGKQIQKVSSQLQKLIAWFKHECHLEVFYVKKSWWGGGEDMAVVVSLTLFIFCNYCFIQEYIFFGKQIQKVSSHLQKLIAWFKRECHLEVIYVKKKVGGGEDMTVVFSLTLFILCNYCFHLTKIW